MTIFDYDIESEEAHFEPIEAEHLDQAVDKIKEILRLQSVWAHGSKPFTAEVRITDRSTGYSYTFVADCAAIPGSELLGSNLADLATKWGAERIEHLGGNHFVAHKGDDTLRMLADEGSGSIEGDEGFEEAWDAQGE